MGQTIAEKILSAKSGKTVTAGELVVADVDLMMGHDFNAAMTIQVFNELGAKRVAKPDRAYFVFQS
jgi:3-isopropylmalate/(R)-2-methylmalate dehydratase large subunit